MKRKGKTLFFWGASSKGSPTKKAKHHSDEADVELVGDSCNFQLELILTPAPNFKNCLPVPYEILMKIFKYTIVTSDNPLKDLYSLSRVCELWRQIIIQAPTLWFRLDLLKLPKTDRNIASLAKIFKGIPSINEHIQEVSIGGTLECKKATNISFVENLIALPKLHKATFRDLSSKNSLSTIVIRSLQKSTQLRELNIIESGCIFNNQKWLSDHLYNGFGQHLETLNLAMSLTSISNPLFKSLSFEFCPNLKVLDISTCDVLNTRSFDATILTQTMPRLEVLRVANITFKRVPKPPDDFGLTYLRELSMPIGMRDLDRDDALFATLTFGSDKVHSLDLRGSTISANALLELPSYDVTELHMDDICTIQRQKYHRVIAKWSRSLKTLSLIKINCEETIKQCLDALMDEPELTKIKELDLSSSDITGPDLIKFLKTVKTLDTIKLASCRSLPRGCKGIYSKTPLDRSTLHLKVLMSRLKRSQ